MLQTQSQSQCEEKLEKQLKRLGGLWSSLCLGACTLILILLQVCVRVYGNDIIQILIHLIIIATVNIVSCQFLSDISFGLSLAQEINSQHKQAKKKEQLYMSGRVHPLSSYCRSQTTVFSSYHYEEKLWPG